MYTYIHQKHTYVATCAQTDRQDAIQITIETGRLFIYIYINTCIQPYTAINIHTYTQMNI
jgi:hypothetical protein